MTIITRYTYNLGTAYVAKISSAGKPTKVEIDTSRIVQVNKWYNHYGNPSYVFFVADDGGTETLHYLVDDYGAMNDVYRAVKLVDRRKDLTRVYHSHRR